jgi:hypothetical protein
MIAPGSDRSASRLRGAVLALALAGLVAGCANVGASVRSAVDDVTAAFDPPKEEPKPEAAPTYCYRTLGKVSCYTQPLPAREANRLVGYEGPAPRASSGTGPLSP